MTVLHWSADILDPEVTVLLSAHGQTAAQPACTLCKLSAETGSHKADVNFKSVVTKKFTFLIIMGIIATYQNTSVLWNLTDGNISYNKLYLKFLSFSLLMWW